MLFFLLLEAAPAMNHPSASADNSPRKIWIEIDSQILNALFCVTGFGLAPWRFRDLYRFVRAAHFKNRACMDELAEQNKSWFRPPLWARKEAVQEATEGTEISRPPIVRSSTFTGKCAPPTPLWKLGFTIWMMVLNTLIQVALCYYMWAYNRIDRPVSKSRLTDSPWQIQRPLTDLYQLDLGHRYIYCLGLCRGNVCGYNVMVGGTEGQENRGTAGQGCCRRSIGKAGTREKVSNQYPKFKAAWI